MSSSRLTSPRRRRAWRPRRRAPAPPPPGAGPPPPSALGLRELRPDGAESLHSRGGKWTLGDGGCGEFELSEIRRADEHGGHGVRGQREAEGGLDYARGVPVGDERLEGPGGGPPG